MRKFNARNMGVGLMVAGLAIAVSSTQASAGEVNLMTWEGYADDSFIKDFEEASGCKVSATYVGSNDDFAPKLSAGGGVYDLISPSIDTAPVMIKAGLVEAVDLSKIERYNEISA